VERLDAVRFVWNDGGCASSFEPLSKGCTVKGFVAEKFLRSLGAADQAFGNGTIMGFAARQQDGKKAAFSICDCVDFRIAPAARASNRLRLLPPFPPEAERCALI
jgi:hypothetical protein